jgi:ABC-type dipeptide/oligopeptide/nickel transport system permease subunit
VADGRAGDRARTRLVKSPTAIAGAGIVGALVLLSLLGPLLARHGPYESDFVGGVSADTHLPVGPGAGFPFGADRIFRDVFARVAVGGRLSLAIALSSTLLAATIGAVVGIVAGYYEARRVTLPWPAAVGLAAGLATALLAWPVTGALVAVAGVGVCLVVRFGGPRLDLDGVLMRFVDVMLAFPFLLLVMAIGAALQKTSAITILVTLGMTGWLGIARVLRAKTMQVRSLDYVTASRALGQSTPMVMLRHVLPNVAGPLVVTSTMLVAQMIVADSVLSYLGVGIAPPTPTWGRMLYEGQDLLATMPWLVAAPGAAILLSVWGFNMLGEGLRDALDPHEV